MHQFEVWAPLANKLAVSLDGKAHAMDGPGEQGWWRVAIDETGPGADYGFLIDDDPTPYPDPRSLWQPNGVHGLSRIYDPGAFQWSDKKFHARPLASAIVYELHIGTFTAEGTLDAAIAKLDYLVELGITHVELMPVAAWAGDQGWGYDGVALYAVHQPYGGPDALKRFVNAAHLKDLVVLLDVVYNHFGPVGNYAGKYAPYITDSHHTPWGGAVNLEQAGSHHVRRFLLDNAIMWMRDYHIDGLRLDAVHAFIDRSAIHFLEQLSQEVNVLGASLGRELVVIAESDLNDPRLVTPREAGGYGMDAQWSDDFHHALFTLLSREPLEGAYYSDFGSLAQLAKALERTFVYDGIYSRYRHRVHGRPAGNLSQHHFIGFIQDHDQVGNRAVGDRIAEIAGFDRAKVAAAIVLTSPFVPMLFQGEEWAASSPFQFFADHEDPEMARLVSEGRRREFAAFGWNPDSIPDPEKRETFERSKLKWNEIGESDHAGMLAWHRDLIRLRRTTPSLNDGEPGNTRVCFDEKQKWLLIERGAVSVCCNLGASGHCFEMSPGSRIVLTSGDEVSLNENSISLPPDTVVIVVRE